jgi:hypothetical protein
MIRRAQFPALLLIMFIGIAPGKLQLFNNIHKGKIQAEALNQNDGSLIHENQDPHYRAG